MSRLKIMRDIDFAALGMLGLYFVAFREDINSPQDFFMIFLLIALTVGLWRALSADYRLSAFIRITIAVMVFSLSLLINSLQESRLLLLIFLSCMMVFASSNTHWGRCLRCLSGLTASCVLFSTFPPIFGLPAAILAIVVFVGGLLSVWSRMTLNESIWWFAKRSFRKETIFLLMFLGGIGALGVRQAQNYSSRQVGVSGMSDMVSPGGVRSLLQSKELALRVRFKETPVFNPGEIYIRGAVMDRVRGLEWMTTSAPVQKSVESDSGDFQYEVSLSPRHNVFTPVIDYGVIVTEERVGRPLVSFPRSNAVFPSGEFHTGWRHYSASSRLHPVHGLGNSSDAEGLLKVDADVNNSVLALATDLKKRSPAVENFIANLTSFYLENKFSYELNLQKPVNTLEDFLFNGREGFCEHYASASAALARLSGIPARVVTGFLGGSWDPLALTLYVRDLDAHAWNEFWDEQKGRWIRYDAVAFLAPLRFERGALEYLRSEGYFFSDFDLISDKFFLSDLWIDFSDILSGFNSGISLRASETMIQYGEEMALLGAFGLLISYVVLVQRRHRKNALHPERVMVQKLERLFEKYSMGRKPFEPVYVWLLRCAEEFKMAEHAITAFADSHSLFCHGRVRSTDDLELMRQHLKTINLLLSKKDINTGARAGLKS